MMKKRGIRAKIIIRLFLFAVVIVVLTGVLTGYRYYRLKIQEYTDIVYGYLRSASDIIDGDRIEGYVESQTPDEYYDYVLKYLTSTQQETDLNLFYVFVPYEDDLVYVWQTDEDPYSWLGYRENYMDGGKETRDATFRKDPEQTVTFYNDPTYGRIACGFYPIFDSKGEPVALVGLDLSTPDLNVIIFSFVITIVVIVILAALVAGYIFYVALSHQMVNPLKQLNDSVKRITSDLENDELFEVDIHTGDEIEELSDSFRKMHDDIKHYINLNSRISAEKGRLDAELNLAARIQSSALPRVFPPFPDRTDFDIYATMDPAKEVGGDFYDFFLIDDDHLAMTVADVSGKGIPAAIFSMITMITIHNNADMNLMPAEVISRTNDRICENNDEDMFCTVWFGILDLKTGVITAVNAGHEYPLIRHEDGVFSIFEDGDHGLAIGLMPGMTYTEYQIQLQKGDAIFQYTDGVPEATALDNALFTVERAVDALNTAPKAPIKDLLSNVANAINTFVGEADQFDDITMLCLEYKG